VRGFPWFASEACSRFATLAGQLPESKEEALLVLQAATRLVTLPGFWDGEPEQKLTATVVLIGGYECA
jgi:hypothetical protein